MALAALGAVGTLQVVQSQSAAAAVPVNYAKTPPMGFNDWNSFGCKVDEQLIKQTADLFLSKGLKAAGYTYVNIDDCWMTKTRDTQGHLVPDPVKFPSGIKGTADYVHGLGLKLGIYESAGTETCQHYPGSLGHEQTDANDFAAWGVDLLKYDNCGTTKENTSTQAQHVARYQAMADALTKTGRKIVYSLCQWGQQSPWTWGSSMASLWRTTGDISDNWASLKKIIAANAPLSQYARPGAWNDPDMLEVGNGGMTDTEYRTHFAMWAVMAAPLLIGTDLRTATPETMAILTNTDLIAVDQDSLGVQGQIVASTNGTMVLSKPLANGDRAVALYNPTDAPAGISIRSGQLGLPASAAYRVKDLWSKGTFETAGTISADVPPHGTAVYRVKAIGDFSTVQPLVVVSAQAPANPVGTDLAVAPGRSATFTSAVTNYGKATLSDVRVTGAPSGGWTVSSSNAWSKATLATEKTLTTSWSVTAPAGAAAGSYLIPLVVTYAWGDGHTVTVARREVTVRVLPTPPTGTAALSGVQWVSATNGWGPVEKDLSNGGKAAGDGKRLSIRGKTFDRGLGTNATSDILYYLGGVCSSFSSTVGIDDDVTAGHSGDAVFQVFGDDTKTADSGVLTSASAPVPVTANLTGLTWLRLHVDPHGSADYDHADWAEPVLTCH
ncbi:NPCBM/NEW2 domain-containing protein [Kitasatospora herbaricolor]|uniref:Alpha-galactosidase n=1 Tax=Kitasatospora herbaricolor TaxID=68217 RepID=A0ABZ1W303_9ACTN|nr:NPCBM/NEW2 domain-containing protein [Kitasatospora herbaricolor]